MLDSFYEPLLILASGGDEADPLVFQADLALWTLIIFLGMLIILSRYAWKPLIQGLNNREENIAQKIEDADRAHEKAQDNLRQYEEQLASVADKAKSVLDEVTQK